MHISIENRSNKPCMCQSTDYWGWWYPQGQIVQP
jgi:hypothetical protein